jgi:hypothetical protein
VNIQVDWPELDSVEAWFHAPAARPRGSAFLLAHGSGADPTSEFMLAMAVGLAARGFPTLTFRYAYMELAKRAGKPRPPDAREKLEHVHLLALERLRELAPRARPILAGKSLGGRIASIVASKGADARGLVLLGYPLHPPGEPRRQRSEHFPAICQPALFLQGTRDEFCELGLLRKALSTFGGRATLSVVDQADHSFEVPAGAGRTRAEVHADLLDRVDRWEREVFPE